MKSESSRRDSSESQDGFRWNDDPQVCFTSRYQYGFFGVGFFIGILYWPIGFLGRMLGFTNISPWPSMQSLVIALGFEMLLLLIVLFAMRSKGLQVSSQQIASRISLCNRVLNLTNAAMFGIGGWAVAIALTLLLVGQSATILA